ncbi:MAG: cytochrome c biogenesis protein CcmE [Gammaproteobacteria bacterium RIFCSPHIGHO2_12_FULL_42_10]|nr:MAG: cytochrome c biogenesis protein CcmE [Gammaproteobacteria bacterium RIFCSPHIGHO2_12_FULL_42_10]
MNRIHKHRLYYLIIAAISMTCAAGLILYALKKNINAFVTPSQLIHLSSVDYHFNLGGVVKKGSVSHDREGLGMHFIVTDFKQTIPVYYEGILPDLFREGKGVIATGHMNEHGLFIAETVLAKHDENYTPKMVQQP